MKYNKRGISPIIATVLIIMITLSAIAILAGFLVPFVKNSLQKSTECAPYGSYYIFDESFGYNCKDTINNTYFVSIKASFDKELTKNVDGMKIVFNEESGESRVIEIKNGSASSLSGGGVSMAGDSQASLLKLPTLGGAITYVYNASAGEEFSGAEVYPVLKGGRICADVSESINIKPC